MFMAGDICALCNDNGIVMGDGPQPRKALSSVVADSVAIVPLSSFATCSFSFFFLSSLQLQVFFPRVCEPVVHLFSFTATTQTKSLEFATTPRRSLASLERIALSSNQARWRALHRLPSALLIARSQRARL